MSLLIDSAPKSKEETNINNIINKSLPYVLDEKFGIVDPTNWVEVLEAGDILGIIQKTNLQATEIYQALENGNRMAYHPRGEGRYKMCSDFLIIPQSCIDDGYENFDGELAEIYNNRSDAGEVLWGSKLVRESIDTHHLVKPEDQQWDEFAEQIIRTHHGDWLIEDGPDSPKLDSELFRLLGAIAGYLPEDGTIHVHGYQKRYINWAYLVASECDRGDLLTSLGILAYTNVRNQPKIIDQFPEVRELEQNPELLYDPIWQNNMRQIAAHMLILGMEQKAVEDAKENMRLDNEQRGKLVAESILYFVTSSKLEDEPIQVSAINRLAKQIPQESYSLAILDPTLDTDNESRIHRNDQISQGMFNAISELLKGDYGAVVDLEGFMEGLLRLHKIDEEEIQQIKIKFDQLQGRIKITDLSSAEIAFILAEDFSASLAANNNINFERKVDEAIAKKLLEKGLRVINLEVVEGSHGSDGLGGYHLIKNESTDEIDLCPDHAQMIDVELNSLAEKLGTALDAALVLDNNNSEYIPLVDNSAYTSPRRSSNDEGSKSSSFLPYIELTTNNDGNRSVTASAGLPRWVYAAVPDNQAQGRLTRSSDSNQRPRNNNVSSNNKRTDYPMSERGFGDFNQKPGHIIDKNNPIKRSKRSRLDSQVTNHDRLVPRNVDVPSDREIYAGVHETGSNINTNKPPQGLNSPVSGDSYIPNSASSQRVIQKDQGRSEVAETGATLRRALAETSTQKNNSGQRYIKEEYDNTLLDGRNSFQDKGSDSRPRSNRKDKIQHMGESQNSTAVIQEVRTKATNQATKQLSGGEYPRNTQKTQLGLNLSGPSSEFDPFTDLAEIQSYSNNLMLAA